MTMRKELLIGMAVVGLFAGVTVMSFRLAPSSNRPFVDSTHAAWIWMPSADTANFGNTLRDYAKSRSLVFTTSDRLSNDDPVEYELSNMVGTKISIGSVGEPDKLSAGLFVFREDPTAERMWSEFSKYFGARYKWKNRS